MSQALRPRGGCYCLEHREYRLCNVVFTLYHFGEPLFRRQVLHRVALAGPRTAEIQGLITYVCPKVKKYGAAYGLTRKGVITPPCVR